MFVFPQTVVPVPQISNLLMFTFQLFVQDALTDLTAECESVDCVNGMDGCQQAHRGILHAAKYVYKELEKRRLLEKAFSRGEVRLK